MTNLYFSDETKLRIDNSLANALTSLNRAKKYADTTSTASERELLSSIYAAEKAVLSLRSLYNINFSRSNPLLYENMLDKITNSIYHITMTKQDGVTRITLPCLLPHYRENNINIMTEPLEHFFLEQSKIAPLPTYNSLVVVVFNHVAGDKTAVKFRDNDNYEYKQLVNTLTCRFLPDDDCKTCNMMVGTCLDKVNFTEVYLVPDEKFSLWYSENGGKTMLKHP